MEEFEDVKNNLLNIPELGNSKKVGFHPTASKRNSTIAGNNPLQSIDESSDISVMKMDIKDEIPTYKKAIRQQYESALNSASNNVENDFLKKNF